MEMTPLGWVTEQWKEFSQFPIYQIHSGVHFVPVFMNWSLLLSHHAMHSIAAGWFTEVCVENRAFLSGQILFPDYFLLKALFYSGAVLKMCICLGHIWKLRESLPLLTLSCKSPLNSSNPENELKTCLVSIWRPTSCQRLWLIQRPPFGKATLHWPDYLKALRGSLKLVTLRTGHGNHLFTSSCQPDAGKACSQQHSVM